MRRILICTLSALLMTTGLAEAALRSADRPSPGESHARAERTLILSGILEDRSVSGVLAASGSLVLDEPQLECTFSATCNADGTIDLSTEGCTPSANNRILRWVLEICSS